MICGKKIYPNITEAVRASKQYLSFANTKRSSNIIATKPYFCIECNGYHLYSKSKNKAKKFMTAQHTNEETKIATSKKRHDTLNIFHVAKFKIK